MRIVAVALLALLAACETGPTFAQVQEQDTLEAYEAFVAANPGSIYQTQIDKRLDDLYFEKAKAEGTLAGYDVYLQKMPKGKHVSESNTAREKIRWDETIKDGSPDAWRKFVAEFPTAQKDHKGEAEAAVAAADYGKLTIGEPKVEMVNLAKDPAGEKNGWGVTAEVKNEGDKSFEFVELTLAFLGDDGSVLDRKAWPLTSPTWTMPAPEIAMTPIKPGEARVWEWTGGLDRAPQQGWDAHKVRLTVSGLREAKAAAPPP